MSKQNSEKSEATSAVGTIVRRTEPLNEVTLFGVNYDGALNNETQDGWCRDCCMACKHWRATNSGNGECTNLNIYTDEGFSCADFIEIKLMRN